MKKEHYFQIIIFLSVIGICVLILFFREELEKLGEFGYLGSFLISLLANATIFVPAPGWIIIAGLAAIFNPWLIGFLAGLGAALGQTTGYLLGYSGRIALKDSLKYQKMAIWMDRWGGLIIFLFALIPNPLADIAGGTAGILRFPFLKFLFFCALGTIPKYIFFALFGGWGLEFLL